MSHLGHMYANGIGAPLDQAQAFSWFNKGAKAGSSGAMYGLGYMYLTGTGVEANAEKALSYFGQVGVCVGGWRCTGWDTCTSQARGWRQMWRRHSRTLGR